jgi:short-subunit dehydrogenase
MSRIQMKRALVTGAAHGIGLAIARRFAARGAEVVLTDLDEGRLEDARGELAESGARCRAYPLDVTDGEAVREVRDRLHSDAGTIDILVNNAGVVFGGPFLEVPLERHRHTYRVNVEGVVAMTHAFLPDLIASPRGHLVNMASLSGFVGLPNGATYASSKWAVIGFSESIRLELKKYGHKNVDVTSVCPNYVRTGMFAGATPPKTTAMLEPDAIAAKVVEAVESRKVWVLEPWIAKLTPFLKNCLPTAAADFLADAFGATTGMDAWRGHGTLGKSAAK